MTYWMQKLGRHSLRWHLAVSAALFSLGLSLIAPNGSTIARIGSTLYGFSVALVLMWNKDPDQVGEPG